LFHDVERTLASLALVHLGEVAGYERYLDDLLPVAELALAMTGGAPTPRGVGRVLGRRRARGLSGLLRLSRHSAAEVLRDYFTSEALLGPVATTGPGVWGLPPQAPGSGFGRAGLRAAPPDAHGPPGRRLGRAHRRPGWCGARRRREHPHRRTRRRNPVLGRARGRRRARRRRAHRGAAGRRRGRSSHAVRRPPRRHVACRATAPDALAQPRGREGCERKIDAIIDVLPRARGIDEEHLRTLGIDDPLVPTAVVAPTLAGIAEAQAAAGAGGRPTADPEQRPLHPRSVDGPSGGAHVFSLEVLFTPYRLAGGWAGSTEPERWLAAFAELLEPGFLDGVQRWRLVGPEDYERDFSMPAGYAPSFEGGPLAALTGRDRELTRYASAIPGLYVTGAGTFPGAGVSGAPGPQRRRRGARAAAALAAPGVGGRRGVVGLRLDDDSADELCEIATSEAELSPVVERRDNLAVTIKEPSRVNRGDVRDLSRGPEPHGVTFGGFLRDSRLVVVLSREVQHISNRLVGGRRGPKVRHRGGRRPARMCLRRPCYDSSRVKVLPSWSGR